VEVERRDVVAAADDVDLPVEDGGGMTPASCGSGAASLHVCVSRS
jgi:hypothetical protein